MTKRRKNKKNNWTPVLIGLVLLLGLILAAEVWFLSDRSEMKDRPGAQETEQALAPSGEKVPDAQTEPVQFQPIGLDNGLTIAAIDDYVGAFMEDGTNEVVSGVMMLIVSNDGDNDLQYAEIQLSYPEGQYDFAITNLPAGASAVVLEQNRQERPEGIPESASTGNIVFFQESMSVYEDIFEISGAEGVVNVKNISDQNITGDIYVYYKYADSDYYYGGITFRVKIENGLEAGEIRQTPSGHYNPETCEIMLVTYVQ